jgi:hypothetical protein
VEKVCVALWRDAAEAPGAWAVEQLLPRVAALSSVRGATLHAEAPSYDGLRHGTGTDATMLTGLVSLWADSYQDVDLVALLAGAPYAAWHAYLVTESVPQPYGAAMTWAEGERSPGLSIITLLDKPADVAEPEFYRCWHGLHRLTTAECHPFTSYVRNEVVRPLTDAAPAYRGIVTESAPDDQDFLDPHRFYVSGGDPERLKANQKRVFGEVVQFIDLATIQVAPMSEYVVRRLGPTSP